MQKRGLPASFSLAVCAAAEPSRGGRREGQGVYVQQRGRSRDSVGGKRSRRAALSCGMATFAENKTKPCRRPLPSRCRPSRRPIPPRMLPLPPAGWACRSSRLPWHGCSSGRSDARGRSVKVNLTLELYVDETAPAEEIHFDYPDVSGREAVVIVGGGPAGLFCALRLIERGLRPVILERGRGCDDAPPRRGRHQPQRAA